MANVDFTNNNNYVTLSAGQKTAVDSAVTAMRAAYAATATNGKKTNVNLIFKEVIKGQEET